MLTVAYCRVSTEEQAEDGFSIEGQADKLRGYSALHDLGEVVVIDDRGLSGKNTERPGLQRLLRMVEEGHVANVLIWRLDRLSRDVGDLARLADVFKEHDVKLHSFTERLDMDSATGRMFYNVLASFAQFYREQLAENVRMGMSQAVREGNWINRPKTGYDLQDGLLVPNDMAPTVREIFRLRIEGKSYREIEEQTGVKYSTVSAILKSRIYLGETQLRDQWFPGRDEPLVCVEDFDAAQRGHVAGRRRSRHVLTGRVRCGVCGRLAAIEYTSKGRAVYRCRHRGQGCSMPRRAADALERAAVLGLRLIGQDESLRSAIREQLDVLRGPGAKRGNRQQSGYTFRAVERLEGKRRKLLDLYYSDAIDRERFAEEDHRLAIQIELATAEQDRIAEEEARIDQAVEQFEQVAEILASLDVEEMWQEATPTERRLLIEEMLEEVAIFGDHLEVVVAGAPRLNVSLEEVGLPAPKSSTDLVQTVGVRGGT